MDWTILLRAQQTNFIQRLKSGHLLNCDIKGIQSELTVISGERLKKLRDFCWEMVRQYRREDPYQVFINNLKRKLVQELMGVCFDDLLTLCEDESHIGYDGKVNFAIASQPDVRIQVKVGQGGSQFSHMGNQPRGHREKYSFCLCSHSRRGK